MNATFLDAAHLVAVAALPVIFDVIDAGRISLLIVRPVPVITLTLVLPSILNTLVPAAFLISNIDSLVACAVHLSTSAK